MKEVIRDNYRLEVLPGADVYGLRLPLPKSHEAMLRMLSEIEAQIRRHVDEVRDVVVMYDTREECSFCHLPWEELSQADFDQLGWKEVLPGEGPGIPQCCAEAQEEWLERNATLCLYGYEPHRCDTYAAFGEEYCWLHLERVQELERLVEQTAED